MTECVIDTSDNYPYDDSTFSLISRLAPLIQKLGARFGVDPSAVAGSIADEYNTRRGARSISIGFKTTL